MFGEHLLLTEKQKLAALLPRVYFPTALQIGELDMDFLEDLTCGATAFFTQESLDHVTPRVISNYQALPAPARSVDLVVLPHLLDTITDPFPMLRELGQIIAPGGYLALMGLNPYSLWGLSEQVTRLSGRPRVARQLYSVNRVQDWLSLLSFKLDSANMVFYRPPVNSVRWLERLEFLEKSGARWWPGCAAAYMLVARKQEVGVRPIPLRSKRLTRLRPGLVEPLARKCA